MRKRSTILYIKKFEEYRVIPKIFIYAVLKGCPKFDWRGLFAAYNEILSGLCRVFSYFPTEITLQILERKSLFTILNAPKIGRWLFFGFRLPFQWTHLHTGLESQSDLTDRGLRKISFYALDIPVVIGVVQRARTLIEMLPMIKIWQQSILFLQFLLAFPRIHSFHSTNNNIDLDEKGARAPSIQIFANLFKCSIKTERNYGFLFWKLQPQALI